MMWLSRGQDYAGPWAGNGKRRGVYLVGMKNKSVPFFPAWELRPRCSASLHAPDTAVSPFFVRASLILDARIKVIASIYGIAMFGRERALLRIVKPKYFWV